MAKQTSAPAKTEMNFSLAVTYTTKQAGKQSQQTDLYDPGDIDTAVATLKTFMADNPAADLQQVILQYRKQVAPGLPAR